MARPRKTDSAFSLANVTSLMGWAETLGEALGRGMARGINSGLAVNGLGLNTLGPRPRGRPPKAITGGPVPADRRCKVEGCVREARSKGLCSAHYQAERRRQLAKS